MMNIFFCATPFQLFLVDKITDNYLNPKKSIVVFMPRTFINTEKLDYYSNKLKKKGFAFLFLGTGNSALLFTYLKLLWFTKLQRAIALFANRDFPETYILIRYLPIKEVRTFDDEATNLVIKKLGWLNLSSRRYRYPLKGSKWQPQYLEKNRKTIVHYTIFPQHSQIMQNLVPIPIIPNKHQYTDRQTPAIRILLPQNIKQDAPNWINSYKLMEEFGIEIMDLGY